MSVDPRAGPPADTSMLGNIPQLMMTDSTRRPDPAVREQRVAFGMSGQRGSVIGGAFNEDHTLTITRAICLYQVGTPG